ncbi:MAG: hypothetical protein R3D58_14450 [Saprospiraceae bacterium]
MKFSPNTIYYIYNQGNNHQRIFFKDEMGLAAGLKSEDPFDRSLEATPSLNCPPSFPPLL